MWHNIQVKNGSDEVRHTYIQPTVFVGIFIAMFMQ